MMHLDTDFFVALCLLKIRINPFLAMDWAYELLNQGVDTYHLRILAGLEPHQMVREETWEIVKKVLDDLNVVYPSREKACKIYLTTLLHGYLQQQFTKYELLERLHCLCVTNRYNDLFYTFYLLYHEGGNEGYTIPGLYYDKLENFEKLDEWINFEVKRLLNFLENENEEIVLEYLKDLSFHGFDQAS
jgi:hypothetical protein